MHFPVFLLLVCSLGLSATAAPAPVDMVIVQVQRWTVPGAQWVEERVLVNGVVLTDTSQELKSVIKSISADPHIPSVINKTSAAKNHSLLRSRECIQEGSLLIWKDRVFCEGTVCLTLDHTDTWMAHVPDAMALKASWDQEVQRTRAERLRLQEGCAKLMRELNLSQEHAASGVPLAKVLIPVLALFAFIGLIVTSLLLSKNWGLQPRGVIGSLIHYPKDMSEVVPERKGSGYRTL